MLQAKNHEDHLKHFQKIVQKDEECEKDLYKTVKEAEFLRRKKDNELKKMQDQLIELKRKNSIQIKQAIAKAFQEEEEFQQKILKEKARLDRVNDIYFLLIRIFLFLIQVIKFFFCFVYIVSR